MTHSHRDGKPCATGCIRLLGLVLGCLATTSIGAAQEAPVSPAAADAAFVQPFVDETTFLILKVDLARIALPNLEGAFDALSPEAKAGYAGISEKIASSIKQLRVLADDQPVYATIGIPISKTRVPVRVFFKKTSEESAEKLTALLKNQFPAEVYVRGDYVVATPLGDTSDARPRPVSRAASEQTIADAFQPVAGYPVQLLIMPPEHVWRTVRELSPELPRQLGGGPSSVLTEGVQWAALGIDPARLRTEIVIQAASGDAARDLAAHLPRMLRSAYDAAPHIHQQLPVALAERLIGWLTPQVEGNRVKIRVDGMEKTKANLTLLASIALTLEESGRRQNNQQRLKRILIGIYNYYDTHKMLPPADKHRNQNGKHNLSWRVHILPYLGEERLYREFRLDEPWDSPHNKKLVARMPDVYASNSFKPGYTTFLAPVGEDTIFGGAKATTLPQVRDGTSRTIAIVEVTPERAAPWTAPDDFQFDPQNPLAGVKIGSDGRWLCAFADGSVHQLRGDIAKEVVIHLFQMNDGHPIDFDELR